MVSAYVTFLTEFSVIFKLKFVLFNDLGQREVEYKKVDQEPSQTTIFFFFYLITIFFFSIHTSVCITFHVIHPLKWSMGLLCVVFQNCVKCAGRQLVADAKWQDALVTAMER